MRTNLRVERKMNMANPNATAKPEAKPDCAPADCSASTLPAVAGRILGCTVNEFEHRCRAYLMREQEKPNPDNGLIAILCDAVRLGREHCDFMRRGL